MKTYIIGAIVGVTITITVLSVWGLYKQNSRIYQLESFAAQVTNLINQGQQTQK